jgi:hypothetical protein
LFLAQRFSREKTYGKIHEKKRYLKVMIILSFVSRSQYNDEVGQMAQKRSLFFFSEQMLDVEKWAH